MSVVNELLGCNKELINLLMKGLPIEDREDYIGQIDHLLEKRGTILYSLDFKSQETLQAKNLLMDQDQEIRTLLAKQQAQIKEDLKLLKAQKQKNQQYANPYQTLNMHDGAFYDKRK
jgi:flagellar protein FliT